MRYDNEIAYMDKQLNRLFLYIKETDLLKDTLVIITADHGEAFGEDDFYFAHGHSVGIDQIRVPLIFVGPEINKNVIIGDLAVSNIDIFATINELLGIKNTGNNQSTSLSSILKHNKKMAPYHVFFESESQRGVLFDGSYLRRDRSILEPGDAIYSKDRNDYPWRNSYYFVKMEEQYKQIFNGGKKSRFKLRRLLNNFSNKSNRSNKRIRRKIRREKNAGKSREHLKKLKTLGYLN